ncbi:MAG TPA: type II toxin-antitoxin system Phd/YefM family antitoxin [Bryobacteraceae bacterium]
MKRSRQVKYISATEFRSRLHFYLREVERTRHEFVITKRGKPVVRLLPADE